MAPGSLLPNESFEDFQSLLINSTKSISNIEVKALDDDTANYEVGYTPNFKVYIIDPYHQDAVALLQSYPNITSILNTDPRKSGWHADADGLIVRSDTRITAEDFAKAKQLRVIVKQGVGVDNIDLQAAARHGIAIHNTPALNSESVAELSMSLTLALSRRVCEIDSRVRQGERVVRSQALATSMWQKTVGIVGMGNIGRMIAKKWIGAFECTVVGYDPVAPKGAWSDIPHLRAESLDDLLRVADVVTLHVPLLASTRGLISDKEFDLMKDSAFLINCARGGVVDERALLRALAHDRIAGAGLDVMEIEPPSVDAHAEFLKYDNVILTPHIGGSTKENQSNSGKSVIYTLMNVLEGREATGKLV